MEAEDGRHDVAPLFLPKLNVERQKPEDETWRGVGVPTDAERDQREDERRGEKAADVRATALELAVQLYSVPTSEMLILPANVFDLADELVRYIETGVHPA